MNLTKNQKRYASVLGVCLVAFAADQLFLSAPSGANADDPAPPGDTPVDGSTPPNRGPGNVQVPEASRPQTTIAAIFDDIAQERSLDPMNVRDAFKAPSHWLPDDSGDTRPVIVDSAAARAAEAFLEAHLLNAVMANGSGGHAVIDGRSLRLGQSLDGFQLIEVRSRSVILEANGVQVELLLPERARPGSQP